MLHPTFELGQLKMIRNIFYRSKPCTHYNFIRPLLDGLSPVLFLLVFPELVYLLNVVKLKNPEGWDIFIVHRKKTQCDLKHLSKNRVPIVIPVSTVMNIKFKQHPWIHQTFI